MDFSGFSNAEQAHMNKVIEKRQMQDFLRMYATITEKCFNTCCNDFTSKVLGSKEETCVMNCTEKFFKHSERIAQRFGEMNAEAANAAQNQ